MLVIEKQETAKEKQETAEKDKKIAEKDAETKRTGDKLRAAIAAKLASQTEK